MWNKLLNLAAQFWKLADDNERNRKQIEALEGEVHSLWRAVDRLRARCNGRGSMTRMSGRSWCWCCKTSC